MLDELKLLLQVEGNKRVDEVHPADSSLEDPCTRMGMQGMMDPINSCAREAIDIL